MFLNIMTYHIIPGFPGEGRICFSDDLAEKWWGVRSFMSVALSAAASPAQVVLQVRRPYLVFREDGLVLHLFSCS